MLSILAVFVYAVIGGPGVGKTSTIHSLQKRQEIVTEEAATDYIRLRQQEGCQEPWLESDFDARLLLMKLEREEKAIYEAELQGKKRIFTDRGILDAYAYFNAAQTEGGEDHQKVDAILKKIDLFKHYAAVFVMQPFDCKKHAYQKTLIRHESNEEALKIHKLISDIYKKFVPKVIEVPQEMNPDERAEYILSEIQKIESNRPLA